MSVTISLFKSLLWNKTPFLYRLYLLPEQLEKGYLCCMNARSPGMSSYRLRAPDSSGGRPKQAPCPCRVFRQPGTFPDRLNYLPQNFNNGPDTAIMIKGYYYHYQRGINSAALMCYLVEITFSQKNYIFHTLICRDFSRYVSVCCRQLIRYARTKFNCVVEKLPAIMVLRSSSSKTWFRTQQIAHAAGY